MRNETASSSNSPVYSELLNRIKSFMSPQQIDEARECAFRLENVLSQDTDLSDSVVLVAYGGGKDSTYMTGFVRFLQLILLSEKKRTFKLRVCTNRHAAMSGAVMENIARAYDALGFTADPLVEAILVDGTLVRPFDPTFQIPEEVVERNREDILLNGHRFKGDARPTFCNACNLSMVNAFGIAANIDGGVDAIITGDSKKERMAYFAWIRKVAKRFAIPTSSDATRSFSSFLNVMDGVAGAYFAEISGEQSANHPARRISNDLPRDPVFFSIFQNTDYAAGAHWEFLTEFLGFQFDDIMFSFSETDCGNPTIMAHMRGLKAERVHGRSYEDGVCEYSNFAFELMRKKDFPEMLIDAMRKRFESSEAILQFRKVAGKYAKETFGLDENMLVSIVYSPFIASGARLNMWLKEEHPELLPDEGDIRKWLSGTSPQNNGEFINILEDLTGVSIEAMELLFQSDDVPSLLEASSEHHKLGSILRGDPHKKIINVVQVPAGNAMPEVITGR